MVLLVLLLLHALVVFYLAEVGVQLVVLVGYGPLLLYQLRVVLLPLLPLGLSFQQL